MTDTASIAPWRRALAYTWYSWGLSLCYWGIRTGEQAFFRAGIGSFNRAIQHWPQFAAAFYRRGLIRGRELSQYQEAIADMTSAIALFPEWPEPHLQRGFFHRFHGNPHTAIADLQRYLELERMSHWRAEAERQIAALETELRENQEPRIENPEPS